MAEKRCPRCGAILADGIDECRYCGAIINDTRPGSQTSYQNNTQSYSPPDYRQPEYQQPPVQSYSPPDYRQPEYQQPPVQSYQPHAYQQPEYQKAQNNVNSFNEQGAYIDPSWPVRSKVAAGLLALFLGSFGIHKFYLGKPGLGILYLIFCWTYIPSIISFVEAIIYLTSGDIDFQLKNKVRIM